MSKPWPLPFKCPRCKGTGQVTHTYDEYGMADPKDVPCVVCAGGGTVVLASQLTAADGTIAELRAERDANDRAFIEARFREGMREAEAPLGSPNPPYDEHSLAAHWWTRGYAYQARNLRAIEAEQTIARLREALTGLQRDRNCWCELAIGHPKMSDHSAACKRAQSVSQEPSRDA